MNAPDDLAIGINEHTFGGVPVDTGFFFRRLNRFRSVQSVTGTVIVGQSTNHRRGFHVETCAVQWNLGNACSSQFVTVSMHFRGRASLQLCHGLTSGAHLHFRRRTHKPPPAALFPRLYTPPWYAPPLPGGHPCARRKDKGAMVHARFIIPLGLPRKSIHRSHDATARVCSRILTGIHEGFASLL